MQPICLFTSRVPGLLCLNGRPAGELGVKPLPVPVGPQGPLYVEVKPFAPGALPMALRLVFANGRLLPESVSDDPRCKAVRWPEGRVDIELLPETFADIDAQESNEEELPAGALAAALQIAEAVREGADDGRLNDENAVQAVRSCGAVVAIPYPQSDGLPAVGLVTADTASCATVVALRYQTDRYGSVESMWL